MDAIKIIFAVWFFVAFSLFAGHAFYMGRFSARATARALGWPVIGAIFLFREWYRRRKKSSKKRSKNW